MNRVVIALFVIALAGTAKLAIADPRAPARTQAPVLVELFTSQSCSSCPPADALASRLAKDPGLVVVSRPVTYWDRLGWKDTLALEANTVLQRAYATRGLVGDNGVYTPQIVVDGARGTVGSNEAQIRQFIRQSASAPAIIIIAQRKDGFMIEVGGANRAQGELVLIALTSHHSVAIGSGENGGRRITYTNVVRSERKVADWRGGKMTLALTPALLRTKGADRHAVVLREVGGGRVLAARLLPAA